MPHKDVRKATVRQARALRRNAPSTERLLWSSLRDRRLQTLKFRRQFPVGPYVLDFVCLQHRIAIEADGPFHHAPRDAERDAWLASKGLRVLRFSNSEINGASHRVINRILSVLGRPSPLGEF